MLTFIWNWILKNWQGILFFIAGVGFDIYIFFLLLRVLFRFFNVNYHTKFANFIFKSGFITRLIGKVVPIYKNIDFPTLVLVIILEYIKIYILTWLNFHTFPALGWLMITPLVISQIISQILNIWIFALFFRILLGWMEISPQNPFLGAMSDITEFLLRPFRRFVPIIHHVDVLAIVMIILLKCIDAIIFFPIINWSETHLIRLIL